MRNSRVGRRHPRAACWQSRCILAVLALVTAAHGVALGTSFDDVIDEKIGGNESATESQATIENISDDIDTMVAEYRRALQEIRSLQAYNRQVEDLIFSQEKEITSLQEQIDSITVVSRQVMPLMERMINTLESFVALDLPFLPEERRERVAGLRSMMNRADVTISEKYRRTLEAYQIENEYGRTIEAYRASLRTNGSERTVDFLRVGRVALLYQTLDTDESGMWDSEQKAWTRLPAEYRSPIRQGLRMARKQVAPDLIRIPVEAATEVKP